MTLATHSVVGALVATSLAPVSPVLAVVAAFGSHFALDALPHWDYKLLSMSRDEHHPIALKFAKDHRLVVDLVKIGFDLSLGFVGTIVVFTLLGLPFSLIAFFGLMFAVVPDFLQFIYSHLRILPLGYLQYFHTQIHSDHRLDNRPIIGVVSQVVIVVMCAAMSWWYL